MTTILSDTFTGSDATELNGRALDVGGTWVCASGNGIFQIISNRADSDTINDRRLLVVTPSGETDYTVSSSFTVGTTGADRNRGLLVRCDGSAGTNRFLCRPGPLTDVWEIVENTTVRASTSKVIGAATYALQAVCSGGSITATIDGGDSINYGSAATTGRTWVGIGHGASSDASDDFLVDVSGAAFVPFPYPRGMAGGLPSMSGGLSVA